MRSEIYQNLYPDELMLETFGKLNPSSEEKAQYFFTCWRAWHSRRLILTGTKISDRVRTEHEVRSRLQSLGFKNLFDFQVRGSQVRFRADSDLALAKLTLSDVFGVQDEY